VKDRISITLERELLEFIEAERGTRNRSEYVEDVLRQHRARRRSERYVRGYLRQPESEQELAEVDAIVAEAWADEEPYG
jgi:metal-responsive CopG/Arc/MetJ family transcriptional regulator